MKNKEGSILGWAETNINWTPSKINKANYVGRKIHKNFKPITTSSNEADGYKQMGRTCTALTDDIVGRHMTSGEGESRLGRWTYVCIVGKDNRKLYVITGYHPGVQTNPGTGTVNAQHKRLFTMKGKPNAHVRKEWDKDILRLIK
eukprot:15059759-Ditylum_brightwellii.AAC.1